MVDENGTSRKSGNKLDDEALPYKPPPSRLRSLERVEILNPDGEIRPRLGSLGNLPIPANSAPSPNTLEDVQNQGGTGGGGGVDALENIADLTESGFQSSFGNSTIVPPDNASGIPPDVLGAISNPKIEDDSPAAEALRATAEIHVRRVGKFARRIHAQNVRKMLKRAAFIGNKRGKPPKLPPHRITDENGGIYTVGEAESAEEEEEIASADGMTSLAAGSRASRMSSQGELSDFIVDREPPAMVEEKQKRAALQIPAEDQAKVSNEVLTGTMETGRKLLQHADPHDILQTQRWRRRRRRGKKDDRKSYVKGKVIDGQHELYALSIAVMLGVRTSIGTTNSYMFSDARRWLSSDDFMATEKYEFSPSGGPRTPPHQLGHTFKFKDYSPVAFAYLRRLFGINEFDFLLSVCGNANFIEFISNAKSGQFFFYSSDGKFMIKTMTNAESKFLRRILPHYFRHCCQNPNTLMTKFLGMYRVKLYHLRRNVKFIIMNSVYYTDKYLQNFFDLKGSVTGRDAKPGQDVKKDNDLRRGLPYGALAMDPTTRERIRQQVAWDCEFMRKMKIMDYSMLIGIHHVPLKGSGRGVLDKRTMDTKRDSMKLKDIMRTSMKNLTSRGMHNSLPERLSHVRSRSFGGDTPQNSAIGSESKDDMSISSQRPELRKFGTSTPAVLSTPVLERAVLESERSRPHNIGLMEFGLLDEDDDNSYLEGSANYEARSKKASPLQIQTSNMEDLEVKKEQTIEQVYWPFHRLYDIHGHRRMIPSRCRNCGHNRPCTCQTELEELEMLQNIHVPAFIPPLSDRKDGGIEMDTTGYKLPLKFKTANGREHQCDGKIFYVGIIDVLQQYNIRKRLEARYRRARGSGWQDASCVHPDLYAERFVRFFEEYSAGVTNPMALTDGEEGIVFSNFIKPERKKEEEKEEEKEVTDAGEVNNGPATSW